MRVFWCVDAQVDFMEPDGKLYVRHLADPADPGAVVITDNLVRLATWARDHADFNVYTGDWHTMADPEISLSPDFANTFPPHCMSDGGAQLIPPLRALYPQMGEGSLPIITATGSRETGQAIPTTGDRCFIAKQVFDVFAHATATEGLVAAFDKPAFLICGVATDVCVKFAVEGLLERGYPVTVATDACYGLGITDEQALLAAWRARGAHFTTVAEVIGS